MSNRLRIFRRRRLALAIVTAVSFSLLANRASAVEREAAFEAVVRIANRQEGGASLGSGTLVDVHRQIDVVITCAHLFTDGVGDVFVLAPGGRPRRALVAAQDEENDLACLILGQRTQSAVTIADTLPRIGAELASCGFGPEGRFHVNRGPNLAYVTLKGGAFEGLLELAGSARKGDSGGPIFNVNRALVGVIMGTDGESVNGTHCLRIHDFLIEHPITSSQVAESKRLAAEPGDDGAMAFTPTLAGRSDSLWSAAPVGRLSGHVLFDRRGIRDAVVRLSGRANRQTALDADGGFSFDSLPAGRYRLDVEKIVKNKFRAASETVVVTRREPSMQVDLQLE